VAFEYSAENHDWDLTLHAAGELTAAGLRMDKLPTTGTLSKGFSFFTGGMVLAFAAIESFSASVAFSMPADPRFSTFDYERYRATRRFWGKMEQLMSSAGIIIDKGEGIFQRIGQMQDWRNLVTHASPYEIEVTEIPETVKAPSRLHANKRHLEYTRMTDGEHARIFYETACAFINLVKERTGLEPHASVTYRPLE